ncbi:MAG: hypothetical protein D5R99_09655 [Methanocalculus sp. MSAO_Arc1]|nr:MAG: hypothetical protein D5R99_09655 [Methanocalculus sp. MSAO_Arc1]
MMHLHVHVIPRYAGDMELKGIERRHMKGYGEKGQNFIIISRTDNIRRFPYYNEHSGSPADKRSHHQPA